MEKVSVDDTLTFTGQIKDLQRRKGEGGRCHTISIPAFLLIHTFCQHLGKTRQLNPPAPLMSFLTRIYRKGVDGLRNVCSISKNAIHGVIQKLRSSFGRLCLCLRGRETLPTHYSSSTRSSNDDPPSLVQNLLDSSLSEVSLADGGAAPENTTSLVAGSSSRDDSADEEEIAIPHCVLTVEQEEAPDGDPEAKMKKKVNKTPGPVGGIIWINHYCSSHRILLVGEGDFSFSACLAMAFQSAPHMIATSLNSNEFLRQNYANAASNVLELTSRKTSVMYKIDATTMLKLLGKRHKHQMPHLLKPSK